LLDGEVDLCERVAGIVGTARPFDVHELISWSEQVAVFDVPRVYGGSDKVAIEDDVLPVVVSDDLVVVLLVGPFRPSGSLSDHH
jgi:hypothetical protein